MVETKGPGGGGPHGPAPSLWPLGLAIGLTVTLVGLVIGSWSAVAVGAVLLVAFAFIWIRDVAQGTGGAPALEETAPAGPESARGVATTPASAGDPALAPMDEDEIETYPRSKFLEAATLGLGGVITGLVAVPAAGFAIAPAFLGQGHDDIDLGPVDGFPQGQFSIATFLAEPEVGEVSRRTAYVRYNGMVDGEPSFTILSNRCVHLGCPVQVNGLALTEERRTVEIRDHPPIEVTPTEAATGFGCPCHGGQYDPEGNRTAGPPVRALDRYAFAIRDGRLMLTRTYSVASVDGEGAEARIRAYAEVDPSVHVDGIEQILYPFRTPR